MDDHRARCQENGRHKPSSVAAPSRAGRDHLSGIRIAPNLERPTRDSGGTGGPSSPIWPCSGWGLPCDPCCQRPGALLPHPFTLACSPRRGPSAVCSLLHFPSPRGARALPGTLPCGARTFLRPASPADSRRRSLSPSSWSIHDGADPVPLATPPGYGARQPPDNHRTTTGQPMFIYRRNLLRSLGTNVLHSRH